MCLIDVSRRAESDGAKTPHSRRRVVSRIETSLRTTAHQLLTLSSTKESGCMHSLSVFWVMLRKRFSKTSRHRKNSLAPLTVTNRPRCLERPRRRRRSEPFSTPKRHFLTENGRPARPLEDPSCTQRQACKVEPRAWKRKQSRAAWSALPV